MLRLAVVQEIRRLLDEGQLSQRKIAAVLGVSRGSVSAIASGRRGMFGKENRSPKDSFLPNFDQPPERCPGCGGMVYMPCLLCRNRARIARRRLLKLVRPDDRRAA